MPQYDGVPANSVPMLKHSTHDVHDLSTPTPDGARRVYILRPRHGHGPLHIQAAE